MARTIGKKRGSTYRILGALLGPFFLVLFSTLSAHAASILIDDQARVLDVNRVRAEAAMLPCPMLIYTTRVFGGEQEAFNEATRQRLPNQYALVIGIDVLHRHVSIQSGTEVNLSDSQANDAVIAFRDSYNDGDYTGATLATLDSLHDALTGMSGHSWLASTMGYLFYMGIGALIIFFALRRRKRNTRPPYGGRNWNYNASSYARNYSSAQNYTSSGGSDSSGGGAGGSFGGGAGGSF